MEEESEKSRPVSSGDLVAQSETTISSKWSESDVESGSNLQLIKSTHNSVTVGWKEHMEDQADGDAKRASVTVEMYLPWMGWKCIYKGLRLKTDATELLPDCLYQFRIRKSNSEEWSGTCVARTDEEPPSATELHQAINYGAFEKAEKILKAGPSCRDLFNHHGMTPLQAAASKGKLPFVELIAEKGADVNQRSSSVAKTALMLAAYNGHLDVVKYLHQNGASWECKDRAGSQALHYAVDGGHTNVVQYALQNGAYVDVRDGGGWTPLSRSVLLGSNLKIVEELIKAGADVNAKDNHNRTCLMHAVLTGKDDMVCFLVKEGADISIKTRHGRTAYDMAKARGSTLIVHMLNPQRRNDRDWRQKK